MLLTIRNISKSYGSINVLNEFSFTLNARDRVGLVGPNGVGKSTLLRLLISHESADQGTISYAPNVEYGYLPQSTPDFAGETIDDLFMASVGNLNQLAARMRELELLMAQAHEDTLATLLAEYDFVSTRFQDRGGYEIDATIDRVMAGLRIAYLPRDRHVHTLSGGEKARVGLAALLIQSPDVLLLDEPTNHLDFATMAWLESYLTSYHGALFIVSHDRHFLNQTVNQIFEIDEHEHHLKIYPGNYDAYIQARERERAKWEEEYEQQQEELKLLRKRVRELKQAASRNSAAPPSDGDKIGYKAGIQNGQTASASRLRGTQQQLQQLEANLIPKPPKILRVNSQFHAHAIQSQVVLKFSHLSKSFADKTLFVNQNLEVGPQARILLTGPNGAGKTTLFKMIMGQEQPDDGTITLAPGVRLGYLPQDPVLDPDKTVIETYRYNQVGYEDEFVARLIGYGLFRLHDMPKKVKQLSLGQQRKLEIACLMAQEPNVLLLDEPTNYISLDILEAFEAAMLNFPGPVIIISHDRRLIERVGKEVWKLLNGHIQNYSLE